VIVINDSPLKAIGENRHAVQGNRWSSLMRAWCFGRRFVVVGYGWCGRGIAQYLRALGDGSRSWRSTISRGMFGLRVAPIGELAGWAQTIITATGRPGVLGAPSSRCSNLEPCSRKQRAFRLGGRRAALGIRHSRRACG
jgi:adenosylhomocysteinase